MIKKKGLTSGKSVFRMYEQEVVELYCPLKLKVAQAATANSLKRGACKSLVYGPAVGTCTIMHDDAFECMVLLKRDTSHVSGNGERINGNVPKYAHSEIAYGYLLL